MALPPFPWFDVALLLVLVAINGLFSMSELAIVSARKARLEAMARARPGRAAGARTAIMLAADPGKFLSTVQIGITLIAVVSGAFSGAALGEPTAARLERLGLAHDTAHDAGLALVIGLTTFASLVAGELVPKQIALRHPEPIAAVAALPMRWLAVATAPLVWLLDKTSALAFHLLGLDREGDEHVTAEELHLIVAEASKSGVIEEHERSIISGVVRLADRPVREVMTPRTEVDWLDCAWSAQDIRTKLLETPHTRLPVGEGSIDAVIGVVQARDIAGALFRGEALDLARLMRKAPVVIDQIDAMDALKALRDAEVPMALIHDEYGHFEGIVTPADLLAAIAGEFASDSHPDEDPSVVERDDGSLLVAGTMAADALADRLGIHLPEDRDYATVAGLALAAFRRLPAEGESFVEQGWRFEVVDLDGRRIDKLLVSGGRMPGRGITKIVAWLLTLLIGLISAPCFADMTAKYVGPNNDFGMTIEIASNGDVRGATTNPNSYFITHDGQSYLVQASFNGPAVMRVDDITVVMAEQMKKLAPDFKAQATKDAPTLELRKGSTVTVRGRSGIAYFMGPEVPRSTTERPVIVISVDPALVPLGGAMAKQFEMSMVMMKRVMGEANPFKEMMAVLKTGAPIVFTGMELESVNNDPIPK